MRTSLLIIDSDLGLVFSLGRFLDRQGYESLPAKSIPDAMKLTAELQLSPDVVVVNPALPGAHDFVSRLRREHPALKVVILISDGYTPIATLGDWHIIRPSVMDDASKTELFEAILGTLTQAKTQPEQQVLAAGSRQQL